MKIKLIVVLIIIISLSKSGLSQITKEIKIHFIGNSYTYYNNLPQVLAVMAAQKGIPMITSKSTYGGAELSTHWNNGSDDKPKWDLDTRKVLNDNDFDIVILQEQSMNPLEFPDSTIKYAKLFCDLVKKRGGKVYLYLTWARERSPQMQDKINQVYKKIASENNVKIVPVGKAWEMVRELRPDLKLFNKDGSHPSEIGTYLAACTFFAQLTGQSPVGLPDAIVMKDEFGESLQLMKFNQPEDVLFLQTVARDAVNDWNKLNK